MSSTDVPVGTSTTPGEPTAPPTLTRVVPGADGAPTEANHSPPNRATSARCARVSAFCTRVGRPAAPRWNGTVGIHRHADALADPVRERALLAGHVAGRRRHQPDGQWVDAGGLALVQRRIEDGHQGGAAVHGDERIRGTDRAGRQGDPVEHQVRRVGDEHRVLAARGLALHRVGDDHRVTRAAQSATGGRALHDRAKLALGREPAAAPASEPGRGHLVDEAAGSRAAPRPHEGQGSDRTGVLGEGGGGAEAQSSGHVPILREDHQ